MQQENSRNWSRRDFVKTFAAAGAGLATGKAFAIADGNSAEATFIVKEKTGVVVPVDFTGLSYETSQLAHPRFFSGETKALISHFRLLGKDGVLRIGGNMSEFSFWSPKTASDLPPDGTEGPDPGHGTDKIYRITPLAIDHLAGFLDATGWKLIYGLNLARSEPGLATDEAEYVSKTVGKRLIALQFGNEPDLFKHNNNPKDRWQYPEFIEHWHKFYEAVHRRVPHVAIAGPDTSYQPEWMKRFAEEEKSRITLLTGHYYAGGPPTDPKLTTQSLLEPGHRFEDHVLRAIEVARANGLPYRMSEGNTCYGAGKKGVSDTFASALWAVDFWLQLAQQRSTGINLHGGANGLYTPIAGSAVSGFTARPIFYGMLLAGQFVGKELLSTSFDTQGKNLVGYAAHGEKGVSAALINRESTPAKIRIQLPVESADSKQKAGLWRLVAPSLDSTSGVTLAGAEVDASGNWAPKRVEPIPLHNGTAVLELPGYSAALLQTGEI